MTPDSARQAISADELAARAGISAERVEEFVSVGLLAPSESTFPLADVHRVQVIEAFVAAGVPLATLSRATAEGKISLDYYGDLHPETGDVAQYTYEDVARQAPPTLLRELYAAFGLAEPEPDSRLGVADVQLVGTLLDILRASPDQALMLRVVRLIAEAARRATTGALDVYAEAVSHDPALAGLPPRGVFDDALRQWHRLARAMPDVASWITARHLSRAIEAYSVEATERQLGTIGLLPTVTERPLGVAFVDLAGFTHLTQARGDEAAAAIALRLGELASEAADRHRGRVVKLLGDGVLMVFKLPSDAVAASIELLATLSADGLPPGHAGVHAGTVVARDGDVFGHTVNLAARLADAAVDGELLVSDAVVANIPAGSVAIEDAGTRQVQGIGAVKVYRVTATS